MKWQRVANPPAMRPGFTLVEIMVVVAILAAVALTVAPAFRDQDRLRLVAGVELISSDIELARVMTMSQPDDPVVIVIDEPNVTYWLARQSDTSAPISAADGSPYVVVLGEGRADFADNTNIEITGAADDTLVFNELGGLSDFSSAPKITLITGDRYVDIRITATTGTLTEEYGEL